MQLVATGSCDDGSTDTLKSGLVWSSASTSMATVDSTTGMLTGVAVGTATITVQSGKVQGTVNVNKREPQDAKKTRALSSASRSFHGESHSGFASC